MHPEGVHPSEIIEHCIGASRGKGTPQIVVRFKTEHGSIVGYFALTPKAESYTMDKVLAMGFKGNEIEQINDGECLRGNHCDIFVKHEEYQGKTSACVAYVDPPGMGGRGTGEKLAGDDKAAKEASQYNAALHQARQRLQSAEANDGAQAATNEPYDDSSNIPF